MALSADEVLQRIPQQKPFRFIDRILSIDADRIVGEYTFRTDEVFYPGHFPGDPVTPGVILIEAMCQTGVVALGIYLLSLEAPDEVQRTTTLFTDASVEFSRVVKPGETVRIEAEKVFWRRRKLKSRVRMLAADGATVAEATVSGLGVTRAEH
ncbi:MAG: beta-hydroxyacyl-ACP dehydratase [Deltaproteobacteria bacterium]|nr:beta-hydroxyacyl-ACP dehydratase [Deltaproteobacteria bacterium]